MIALCTGFAILYGVIHDQITARICLEYFTVFHPTIIKTQSPTLLGIVWGILATWWVGTLLGIPLAWAAQSGSAPAWTVNRFYRPLLFLFLEMAVSATIAGYMGYQFSATDSPLLYYMVPPTISPPHVRAFTADFFAHNASYFMGFVGGGLLILWTWLERRNGENRTPPIKTLP